MIVPRVRTPVPLLGLAERLDAAAHARLATCPGGDRIRVACAQLELEHGVRDGALSGVWDENFGNRDASAEDRADPSVAVFTTVPEREVGPQGEYHALHVRRAFQSVEEGMQDWWWWMYTRPELYEAMSDPRDFAAALKSLRYYTAPESDYAAGLARLAAAVSWDGHA